VRRLQEFTRTQPAGLLEAADVNAIVDQALEITATRWRNHGPGGSAPVRVETRCAPLPSVAGDPVQLSELLTNLILNALDAMPAGGLLTISTQVRAAHVVLTVTDTGIGMTEEVRQRVFDPFFTTKGPRGTGLGLSVAYGIVTRHGGQIEVTSAPGAGTTFQVRLPIPATAPTMRPAAVEPAASRSLRCLIVDDNPEVASVMRDALLAAGHSAEAVSDGPGALARVRGERFDVVVTDFSMPGATSWEIAKAARAAGPTTRVIMVSGYASVSAPDPSTSELVDRFLQKPVDLKLLFAALTEAPRA
jgi:CheY-like chemotaxis protein